jgi:hypothetical protein
MRAQRTFTHSNGQAVIMRCCPDMKIFAKRGAQKLHRMNSGAFRREAAAALVWAYIIIVIRIFLDVAGSEALKPKPWLFCSTTTSANTSENPRPTDVVEGNKPTARSYHPSDSHGNDDKRRRSLYAQQLHIVPPLSPSVLFLVLLAGPGRFEMTRWRFTRKV